MSSSLTVPGRLLNNMAEPWNKINIPYPGAVSSCRISFTTGAAAVTEAVHIHCERVLKLLDSHVLHTEILVLHKLLYVQQNRLRQHAPFRAIKQVEQCVKRLKEMKLHGALLDLEDLCPNELQRNVGLDVGHCDVPSQPMLEWFCLKLLGASSLLSRTLDQCTKAFSLTRQHLYLAEFIVLNIVLASMLSRLWVFFRGILRELVPLYQSIMVLLQEVVQCRPMAFLTDFTLPEDMAVFLGSPYSQMLKETVIAEPFRTKKTSKPSILDQLFEKQVEKGGEKEREMMQMLASEELTPNTDLGVTVLRRSPFCSRSSSMLDLKLMLQQTSKQYTAEVFIKRQSPGQPSTSSLSALEQKRMFLKKLKTASSVKDTAALIEEMMSWCRSCKLYKERCYLSFMLLKCQRTNALECTGISVQKKLRRLRVSVHHVMRKGITLARSSILHHRRTKCCFRTRFSACNRTVLRCNGNAKSRVGKVRMHSEIVKDLFNVSAKSSHKSRKHTRPSSLHEDVMSGSDVLFSQKESNIKTKTNIASSKSSNVRSDEIDNIFASFGL